MSLCARPVSGKPLIRYAQNLKMRFVLLFCNEGGRRGHDRMVVGFTTTCVISAYHSPLMLWVRIRFRRGVLIQHYVIEFVSDLRQVGGFLRILPVSSANKTEILLQVALNTINLNLFYNECFIYCIKDCTSALHHDGME